MTHPLLSLQAALLAALRADAGLRALVGGAIHDAPPQGIRPPDIFLARHDVTPRDADLSPGREHRLVLSLRAASANRKAITDMAERIEAVIGALRPDDLRISFRRIESLETSLDPVARVAEGRLTLRLFTETLQ